MATTKLGSNYTMAPEVMRMGSYDFKADIWSIGVVFYQLLFGDYPFKGRGAVAILEKAL
jgi:serine/threonine protein kinase